MIVVTFQRFRPPARYDLIPWTEARIEESDTETGTFTQIDVVALTPADADPSGPDARSFTTENGTASDQWYRVIFADGSGDVSQATAPIQNVAGTVVLDVEAFATSGELAAIIHVNAASNADALDRVLIAAAGEIVSETGRNDFSGWELELVAQVNLARAEELWKQMKAPWGVIGLESEFGPTRIARDTFDRHAHTLAPLKATWGIA